jgi:hypothetical protein
LNRRRKPSFGHLGIIEDARLCQLLDASCRSGRKPLKKLVGQGRYRRIEFIE